MSSLISMLDFFETDKVDSPEIKSTSSVTVIDNIDIDNHNSVLNNPSIPMSMDGSNSSIIEVADGLSKSLNPLVDDFINDAIPFIIDKAKESIKDADKPVKVSINPDEKSKPELVSILNEIVTKRVNLVETEGLDPSYLEILSNNLTSPESEFVRSEFISKVRDELISDQTKDNIVIKIKEVNSNLPDIRVRPMIDGAISLAVRLINGLVSDVESLLQTTVKESLSMLKNYISSKVEEWKPYKYTKEFYKEWKIAIANPFDKFKNIPSITKDKDEKFNTKRMTLIDRDYNPKNFKDLEEDKSKVLFDAPEVLDENTDKNTGSIYKVDSIKQNRLSTPLDSKYDHVFKKDQSKMLKYQDYMSLFATRVLSTNYNWLIKLSRYDSSKISQPDLAELFGSPSYLPVVSYSITESSLSLMNIHMPNDLISVPGVYKRPVSISITLYDVESPIVVGYNSLNPTRIDSLISTFKEDYIKYMTGINPSNYNASISPMSMRDYRDGAYKLDIYRLNDNLGVAENDKFKRTYLVVPNNIAIQDSGDGSKQPYTDTINFTIVGQL